MSFSAELRIAQTTELVAFMGKAHLAAMRFDGERGLALLAMADENRAHALKLLSDRAFAKSLEIDAYFHGTFCKLPLGQERQLPPAKSAPQKRAKRAARSIA